MQYFTKEKIILYSLGGSVLLLIGVVGYLFSNPITKEVEKTVIEYVSDTTEVCVDLKGAVKKTGVYCASDDKRVIDIITMAGGVTKTADTSTVNLSKKIVDEMSIVVHTKTEVKKMNETITPIVSNTNNKISINTASLEVLKSLPGIGDVVGNRIIEYRNTNGLFKDITDLKNVSGIGDALFSKIQESITI